MATTTRIDPKQEKEFAERIPLKDQETMLGTALEDLQDDDEYVAQSPVEPTPVSPRGRPEPVFYLKLDENGEPTGSVLKEKPEGPDERFITVQAPHPERDVLVTPSGAPLTTRMNPDPSTRDPELDRRNPVPGRPTMEGTTVVHSAKTVKETIGASPAPKAAPKAKEPA